MLTLNINGEARQVDAPDDMPLLWVLRDVVGLTGTKFGCGMALCGCCTVHLDGEPVRSCQTAVRDAVGREITTIEAIGDTPAGARIQKAWLDLEVVQCGYCQSGQIMSATGVGETRHVTAPVRRGISPPADCAPPHLSPGAYPLAGGFDLHMPSARSIEQHHRGQVETGIRRLIRLDSYGRFTEAWEGRFAHSSLRSREAIRATCDFGSAELIRRLLKIAAGVALAAVVAAGAFVAWRLYDRDPEISAADAAPTPELIARGKYLLIAADCAACHTVPGGKPLAGGFAFHMPFGTIYSTNITADKETGIGGWSDDDFVRALHRGVAKDGAHLYPAFPYASYTGLSRDDAVAMKAYLFTLPAAHAPARPNKLSFPFNQRWALALWNLAFLDQHRLRPDPKLTGGDQPRHLSCDRPRPLRRVPHAAQSRLRHGDRPAIRRRCGARLGRLQHNRRQRIWHRRLVRSADRRLSPLRPRRRAWLGVRPDGRSGREQPPISEPRGHDGACRLSAPRRAAGNRQARKPRRPHARGDGRVILMGARRARMREAKSEDASSKAFAQAATHGMELAAKPTMPLLPAVRPSTIPKA